MESTQQHQKPNGEVDVLEFIRWIGRGFRNTGNGLLAGIAYLRNLFFSNLKYFGFAVLSGMLLSVVYFELLREKTYESSMVLRCEFFNNQIVKNSIEKLNSLCTDPTKKGLAQELGISDTLARNIVNFDFQPFVSEQEVVEIEVLKEQLTSLIADKKELADKIINRIDIETKDAYKIHVVFAKPETVKKIEKALVDYFRNNHYIKSRIEINEIVRIKRKEKLLRESDKLDSIKTVMYNNLGILPKSDRGSNNVFLNDEKVTDPLAIFREDLAINQEILELETQLFIKPDFEVIDGFTSFSEPQNPSLVEILIASFFISIVICYLVLFAVRFDQILARYPVN
jgi:hypothetical protein